MGRKYFGTDGVRGKVGTAPITPDFVMKLAYAAGRVLTQSRPSQGRPVVLIGKDTRVSGYMLEASLQAGFGAAGVDVMLAGPMPTPAIAYLTRALRLAAGVVISASHNPYPDNGIKFFASTGNKLPDELELAIEEAIDQPIVYAEGDHIGRARRLDDAQGRYIEFCKSTFPNELDLRGLKIVVDCAHGAAYHIAPCVLHELGADVIPIGIQPNGTNINDHCGATDPEMLSKVVVANEADIGIALDGDADRVVMVDAKGRIYDGDELLYVLAKDRHEAGELEGVVGTLMTNMALEVAFKKMGVGFSRARVGDRYVLEELLDRHWSLGGEGSGHILCLDKHTTGDGIISALQVLSVLRRHRTHLAQYTKELKLFPQALVNVKVPRGFKWQSSAGMVAMKEKVEKKLGDKGRVLIRPSGTEPLIRVMVEAQKVSEAKTLAKQIAEQCKA